MKNPAVDACIAKSAGFARPILARLRALMQKACPQIEETIKWGVPHFEYKGVVANMAAFKQHARFGFWKQRLMNDPAGFLPAAVALNEQGARLPRVRKTRAPVKPPADLQAALKKNAKARATARREAARSTRLSTAIEWLAAGKSHDWKCQDC